MHYGDLIYEVQPGDTLIQILIDQGICSNANGDWKPCIVAAKAIADANGLPDMNKIVPGQKLVLRRDPLSSDGGGGVVVPEQARAPRLGWALAGLAVGLGIWVVFGDWR